MPRMIPANISYAQKYSAEIKVFNEFKSMPDTDDWVIMHSVGIARHETQSQGEADFVVIIPNNGVFVLEVKGGIIALTDGVWTSTNYENNTFNIHNPIEQANEGMHSIKNYIQKNQEFSSTLDKCVFGFGVVFPSVDFHGTYKLPDIAEEQIADNSDLSDMKRYLLKLASYWKERSNAKAPSSDECNKIVKLLRPNFSLSVSLASQIKNTEGQIIKLTEHQQSVFSGLVDNKKCLIKGGAGTGKTVIAINFAEDVARDDNYVGLFCYNIQLASHLKERTKDYTNIVSGSFTEFMINILSEYGCFTPDFSNKMERNIYFSETLPQKFMEIFIDNDLQPFDVLIIDEAQDLMSNAYIDAMDIALKNGISNGCLYLFMDAEKQNLFQSTVTYEGIVEMLNKKNCDPFKYTLKENCRNSVSIISKVDEIFDISTKYKTDMEVGMEVNIKKYKKENEQSELLTSLLGRLSKENISNDDIVILSNTRLSNSFVSNLADFNIVDTAENRKGKILYSTIQAFKGLESSVVIMVDINNFVTDKDKSLLYVGMTRAKSALFMFVQEKAYKEIIKQETV